MKTKHSRNVTRQSVAWLPGKRFVRGNTLLIISCVVLSLIFMGCNNSKNPKKVKIAVSLPLAVKPAQNQLKAIQMALDEVNGQVGKISVELLVLNTSDPNGAPVSPAMEQEAALKAIADPQVVAYLGPPSSNQAKKSLPLLNQASLTQISQAASWPGLTKPGFAPGEPGIFYPTGRRHFFRVVPSDDIQGIAAARWAKQLGFQHIYVVDDGQVYGHGISGVFEVTAHDLGLKILNHESFIKETVTDDEFSRLIDGLSARVIKDQPDLLYYGGGTPTGGGKFIRTVRSLSPDLTIMGADGLVRQQFIDDVGVNLAEGIYGTSITIPADQLKSAHDFTTRFHSLYGQLPLPVMVSAYEAMKVLLHVLGKAKPLTRQGVLTAMKNLGEFSGVLGKWHFDTQGDISITAISGMHVQDGAWKFVQIIH